MSDQEQLPQERAALLKRIVTLREQIEACNAAGDAQQAYKHFREFFFLVGSLPDEDKRLAHQVLFPSGKGHITIDFPRDKEKPTD